MHKLRGGTKFSWRRISDHHQSFQRAAGDVAQNEPFFPSNA
jgi:hypothetical protein